MPEHADPAKELQELKKKKGTWKLAPTLINHRSLSIKDSILSVGRATWKQHATRAREVTSPLQVQQRNMACAGSKYWAIELEEMMQNALWRSDNVTHVLPMWKGHDEALPWHMDLLEKILEARAQSLATTSVLCPCPLSRHRSSLKSL